MLASRTSRWVAGTALVCLCLLALTYVLLVSPRRAEAAELQTQEIAAQDQNDSLRIKLAQLKDQFLKLPESQARLAEILRQLPAGPETPTLVRELDAMAGAAGVTLKVVTPGSASTVAGVEGVLAIPQEVDVEGDYFDTVVFLRKLQSEMKRAFLVTGLDLTGASGGSATSGRVSMKITGQTFVLTSVDTSLVATAGRTSPAATASAAASPSPSVSPAPSVPSSPSASPATSASPTPSEDR